MTNSSHCESDEISQAARGLQQCFRRQNPLFHRNLLRILCSLKISVPPSDTSSSRFHGKTATVPVSFPRSSLPSHSHPRSTSPSIPSVFAAETKASVSSFPKQPALYAALLATLPYLLPSRFHHPRSHTINTTPEHHQHVFPDLQPLRPPQILPELHPPHGQLQLPLLPLWCCFNALLIQ